MPNPHIAPALNNSGAQGTTAAMLAVAYELRTANLLNAAAHTAAYASSEDSWRTAEVRRIEQERLS